MRDFSHFQRQADACRSPLIHVIPRYGVDIFNEDEAVAAWRDGAEFALLMLMPFEHAPPHETVCTKHSFSATCRICIKYAYRQKHVTIVNHK